MSDFKSNKVAIYSFGYKPKREEALTEITGAQMGPAWEQVAGSKATVLSPKGSDRNL